MGLIVYLIASRQVYRLNYSRNTAELAAYP